MRPIEMYELKLHFCWLASSIGGSSWQKQPKVGLRFPIARWLKQASQDEEILRTVTILTLEQSSEFPSYWTGTFEFACHEQEAYTLYKDWKGQVFFYGSDIIGIGVVIN